MGDDQDITLLALQAQMGLNKIYQQKLPNRIDPRQFLYGNHQPMPQHYNPAYAPQPYNPQPMPQYGNTGVEDYGIPSNVPVQTSQLPLVMRQPDGTIVDLSQAPSVEGQVANNMSSIQSFNIPDYSKHVTPNTTHIESDSTLEIILKELKSLKKAINKLIRESEKSKLQAVTTSICEPNDQPINDSNS
jgi:hypothetical protein